MDAAGALLHLPQGAAPRFSQCQLDLAPNPTPPDESPSGKRKRGTGETEDAHTAFTLEIWAQWLLVTGISKATQAASKEGGEGRIDLSNSTADELADLTYQAHKPLAGGEVRPSDYGYAPDWWTSQPADAAGAGTTSSSSSASTRFDKDLIQSAEDLQEKVMGGMEGGKWLLVNYYSLLEPQGGKPTPYAFMEVDQLGLQLVVDTQALLETVGRWGLWAWEKQAARGGATLGGTSSSSSAVAAGAAPVSPGVAATTAAEGAMPASPAAAAAAAASSPFRRRVTASAALPVGVAYHRPYQRPLVPLGEEAAQGVWPSLDRITRLCLFPELRPNVSVYYAQLADAKVAPDPITLVGFRKNYSRQLGGTLVQLAGVALAMQEAGPSALEARLDLNPLTVGVAVDMGVAAYKELGCKGEQKTCAWTPEWALEQDMAGVGDDGQPIPFYIPGFIQGPQDVLQEVMGGADAPTWLANKYQELANSPSELKNRKGKGPYCPYDFLSVDWEAMQLVVDIQRMKERVVGWGVNALEAKQQVEKKAA